METLQAILRSSRAFERALFFKEATMSMIEKIDLNDKFSGYGDLKL
jgi:hypothetical protein